MMPSSFLKDIATKAELADFAVKTRSSRSSSKDSCLNVTAPVNISNGKKCSHQSPNPKFSWKSSFLTVVVKNVQTVLMAQHSRKDCGHLRNFLLKHVFCNVFCIFSMVGDPSNITLSTAFIPKADWAQCPLMRLDLYRLFTWNNHVIQSFKPCLKKNREFVTEWWHLYMFLAAFHVGCPKYIKPRIYGVFW